MAEGDGVFGDTSLDGRWLTYAELAQVRGIGRESAAKLAQREKWRRQAGNGRDRQARVFVPSEWLIPAKVAPPSETIPGSTGELSQLVNRLDDAIAGARKRADEAFHVALTAIREAHAGETAALHEQLAAANTRAEQAEARADAERIRADQSETDRKAADGRADVADQALGAERARADALRDRLTAEEAAAAEALQAAEAARQTAEARADRAEQGRDGERARADAMHNRFEALLKQLSGVDTAEAGRQAEVMVSSLLAAHAGEVNALKEERHRLATQIDGFAVRADQAEARAKQAETRIDQADARTDSLRARVDVLQRERDTARAEAAQAAAAALRQAEAERRARGLLARLRGAWRRQ